MRISRIGEAMPIWPYVGRKPMAKVAPPIIATVTRKAPLRPSRSPIRPNTRAPRGLNAKPTPNRARAAK